MRLTQKQNLLLLLAMSAVCLLGWLMFVHHIRLESMWVDEWFSWRFSQMGPIQLTQETAQDVHPPVYYTLLWLWTSLIGSQDLLVMRLTAAFPALLAVAVAYRLGCDWFKSRWAGVGAAVFLATSGILIYYARELRMYALVVLLAAASWWYLWRWLQRGGRTAAIGYVVLVALMLYTYYFSGFIVVTQLVYVTIFYRQQLFRFARLLVLSGITFLPWLPVVFHQIYLEQQRSRRTELFGKYGATAPTTPENIGLFINTYTAKQPGLVLLLALLALLLTYQTATSAAFRRWVVAAALWCFFTITTFFVVNLGFPIYNLRYPLPIITGLALLVGVTVYLLRSRVTRFGVIVFLVVVGMVFHFDGFLPAKAPHRELLQTVAAGYQPGDRIWYNMNAGAYGSRTVEDVYYHLIFDAPTLNTDWFVWSAPKDYQDVNTVRRVWDIRPYWIPLPADAEPDLKRGRTVSESYVWGAYTVQLYEAPPSDQAPVSVTPADHPVLNLLATSPHHPVYRAGETVISKTWWQVLEPPTTDYSCTLILRRAGDSTTLNQMDTGLVALGNKPTSRWESRTDYLLAEPKFQLPDDLPPGNYELWLGVYYWENPVRFALQTTDDTSVPVDASNLARVAEFQVQ